MGAEDCLEVHGAVQGTPHKWKVVATTVTLTTAATLLLYNYCTSLKNHRCYFVLGSFKTMAPGVPQRDLRTILETMWGLF